MTVIPNRKLARHTNLSQVLEKELLSGKYPPSVPLPSENELCKRFDVSRTTVRLALSHLANRGYIYKQHGRGTFAHHVRRQTVKPTALLACEPEKLENPYFLDLIHGANSYLISLGSHLSIISQRPHEWSSSLISSISAAIVIPTPLQQEDLKHFEDWGMPYVIASESELRGPSISYGIEVAAERLTEGLLAMGHRKIGLISGRRRHSDLIKRRGVDHALIRAGIDVATVPDLMTNFDLRLGKQATQELLRSHPDVTAIIASDDLLAIAAMQVAQAMGKRIPVDLSVAGFNDLAMSALFTPALTTVKFPVFAAGRRAAEALCLRVMRNEPLPTLDMGHEILWRESSGQVG